MPMRARTNRSGSWTHPLLWSILVYAVLAWASGRISLEAINTDGVSYILLAKHYANREWGLAVSGHWSPMLSWLLIPFIRLGVDPLHAARVLVSCLGVGFVVGVWMLSGRFALSPPSRALATVSAAVMSAIFSIAVITPDLLVSSLLAFYFFLTLAPDFGRSARHGFACGVLGGLGYLTKAYAGPFFLAHFTLISFWTASVEPRRIPHSRWLGPWAWGLAGFLLISAPWIGIISYKVGYPTISTAAGFNRTIVAPEGGPEIMGRGAYRLWLGSAELPPGRLNLWEDPSVLRLPQWSPFESWGNFRHQLAEILHSGRDILHNLWELDFLKLGLWGTAFAMMWVVRNRGETGPLRIYRWAVFTVGLYCSGYLLVYSDDIRYFWPIFSILLILAFDGADRLHAFVRSEPTRFGPALRTVVTVAVLVVPVFSFVFPPLRGFVDWESIPPRMSAYRTVSLDLAKRGLRGPVSSNDWFGGFRLSYHLDLPYVGPPLTLGEGLENQLRSADVRTFFIWGPLEETGKQFAGRKLFHLVVQYRAEARAGLERDLAVYRVGDP